MAKSSTILSAILGVLVILIFSMGQPALAASQPVINQATETETTAPTETSTPTATATFTITPSPTATSLPAAARPLIVVNKYSTSPNPVVPGGEFNLQFQLFNNGQTRALNLIVSFETDTFFPRETGGVLSVGTLWPGEVETMNQPMTASSTLFGSKLGLVTVRLSYTDENGNPYTENFVLSLGLAQPTIRGATATPSPTPTPTGVAGMRPQLVINSYLTDADPLQPGTKFQLQVYVRNVGNIDAKRVTMIAGGGTVVQDQQTGQGSSVIATGGDFTNFSPLGVSNVQSLGDIAVGQELMALQPLIVNVSTNPGAYSFKISFAHVDSKGGLLIDDQVITLLVYSLPQVEVNFYTDPGGLFAGQPNMLPLQIVNLGRKTTVLGNMRVEAASGSFSNNVFLVGTLDPGGYFTMDATYFPDVPGPVDLLITVDYTDDFNQAQVITRTLSVEVMEAFIDPGIDPGGEGVIDPGIPVEPVQETWWQTLLRFLAGLFGLDSGGATDGGGGGGGEEIPLDGSGGLAPVKGP